jgi:hypothetical protein
MRSERVISGMRKLSVGKTVDERIYPGMGHTINADELHAAEALLAAVQR